MVVELMKPHKGQKEIIKALKNDELSYYILNCGRRFGKSELLYNLITEWALTHPNSKILYVTYVGDQRETAWSEYLQLFAEAPFVEKINKTHYKLIFKNNSFVIFRLATYPSAEGLRGKKFDLILLDEFALYNELVWDTILEPTLATAKKFKVVFASTPRGKGQFYKLYQRGIDKEFNKWTSFHMPSSANPYVSQEFLEDVKKTASSKVYNQEYLAEFIDDAGSLFENIKLNVIDKPIPNSGPYFAGIDLGFINDYTVLTIVDKENNMILYERFNNLSLRDAAKRLTQKLKEYNWPETYIENNMYQGVYEMMVEEGAQNIKTFQTTTQSKKTLIDNLIDLFQNNTIKILNDEYLISELEVFEYAYNVKTRNISYGARQGFHDDCVISLSLACLSNKDNNNKVTFRMIRR